MKYDKELIGWHQPNGQLTITSIAPRKVLPSGQTKAQCTCVCDCGNMCQNKLFIIDNVVREHTRSCGCMNGNRNAKIKYLEYNKYDLSNEFGIGYSLNTNMPFYFDLCDYDKVKLRKWTTHTYKGYVRLISTNPETNKSETMAQYLFGNWYDHINRNALDNRSANLRKSNPSLNQRNLSLRNDNSSGVTGVSFNKHLRKWETYININGKRKKLGYYINVDDAITIRLKAEVYYYKEFAPQKHLFEKYNIFEDYDYEDDIRIAQIKKQYKMN